MNNEIEMIRERLFEAADPEYGSFQAKLMPTVDRERVIGVRTPIVRAFASELAKKGQTDDFLADLPHKYFEEQNLHAFIISLIKDFDSAIAACDRFLPFVDNWATCDQLSPRVFGKKEYSDRLLEKAELWTVSEHTYTIRFGLGILMRYYLDDRFSPAILEKAAAVRSDEYYVNMMIAWLFATALAKQYGSAAVFLEERRLDKWVHNKTIRKAIESYRIPDERKAYLRTLAIKDR